MVVACLLAILLCAPYCSAQELPDEVGPWHQYIQLIRRNTLDLSTNQPFLLRVDYELYDLDGKPVGKGTAEESWGPRGHRINVKSPTLTLEEPSEPDVWIRTHTRESYLVRQVLKSYIQGGHDHRSRRCSSPDPLLSVSALEAVRNWTYKPYLMGGKPTEIDTAITVNYAMGH